MSDYTLLATLDRLRTNETMVLQPRMPVVQPEDIEAVADYLEREYERECREYPHNPPPFDRAAATWAAQTVFFAAHLLLHRQDMPEELGNYLPPFSEPLTPSVVLSVDLSLRFLPDLIRKGQQIDPDDALLPLLEALLKPFEYSALGLWDTVGAATEWQTQACLQQLMVDRIIAQQLTPYLADPNWQPHILASLGDYAAELWPHPKNMTS